jgi:hypothetical protein
MSYQKSTIKRSANDNQGDDGEATCKPFQSLKVALISDSQNIRKVEDNSVFTREDSTKVVLKIQQSPYKKNFDSSKIRFDEEIYQNNTDQSINEDLSSDESFSQKSNVFGQLLVI